MSIEAQIEEISKMDRVSAQDKLERLHKYSFSSDSRSRLIEACEGRISSSSPENALVEFTSLDDFVENC